MAQTWTNLLFAHWPVPEQTLRPLIPAGLHLEIYEGHAWLGITPFLITGLRPRAAPAIPGLSQFPEINVRTYVTAGGKPGVFFFSLDAESYFAVTVARALYSLPYFHARFALSIDGGAIDYESHRTDAGMPSAEFAATYRPTGDAVLSTPGTLTAWLTERYCLYAVDRRGTLHRAEIHHPPWPLRPVAAKIRRNTMTAPLNFPLPEVAPLLHFAEKLEVHVWAPERVESFFKPRRPRSRRIAAGALTALGGALAVAGWARRRRHSCNS